MRKQPIISTVLLAGMLAFGLAFLPACSSGDEAEPAPAEETQEDAQEEAQEEQETPAEEAAEPEPEPLTAWVVTKVTGESFIDHTPYTTAYTLDEHGNCVSTEGSYYTSVSEFDEFGNVIRTVDTAESGYTITTTYEYDLDDAGRPVKAHFTRVDEDPDFPGTTEGDIVTEYHDNGIVSKQATDEVYTYTYEGEENTVTSHGEVEYDEQGFITRYYYTDGEYTSDETYVWEFDDAGNPVSVSHEDSSMGEPQTLVTTFECDENGNIVSRTDQRIITTYGEGGDAIEQEVVSTTQTFEYAFVEDCSQAAYDASMLKG